MSVSMSGRYTGNLGVEVTHGPSGTTLETAAPVDNQGDGSSFSPTDLAAAALGTCMLTLIGIVARREGIELGSDLGFSLEKHMVSDPRRIGSIPLRITMPGGLGAGVRKKLERAALTCPVHRSLSTEIDIPVEFVYPD